MSDVTYWPSLLANTCSCLKSDGNKPDTLKIDIKCKLGTGCKMVLIKHLLLNPDTLPKRTEFLHALVVTEVFNREQLLSIYGQVYNMASKETCIQAMRNYLLGLKKKKIEYVERDGIIYLTDPLRQYV